MRDVASYRMRRVNEAIKEIIGTAHHPGSQGPADRVRHLDGRRDRSRPLPRQGLRLGVRQAGGEGRHPGRPARRPAYLQRLISDELKIKRTPTLEFVYDASVDQGMRIHALLQVERSGGPAAPRRRPARRTRRRRRGRSAEPSPTPLTLPTRRSDAVAAGRRVTAAEVADRLRHENHVLVVSHESPDGDALGCLSAFVLMCERLGVPYVRVRARRGPFPGGIRVPAPVARRGPGAVPVVGPETTVYMLDCASLGSRRLSNCSGKASPW